MAESQTRQVKKLNTRIKLKRDSEANWELNNPVILHGEVIFVTMADGSVKAKVGDGVKKYNELPFSDKALQDSISSLDDKIDDVDDRVDDVDNKVDSVNSRVDTSFEQISAINQALPDYTNQHAFSKIAVNNTNIDADTFTDTLSIAAGDNISITSDASDDSITFSVADGSTTAKGVVQLTDGVDSTSTTTAATPNSVKQAYDKADSAIEQISELNQDFADFITDVLPDYTNQHAFSKIVVSGTDIAADSATDTLTITAGDNISITSDTAGDKITFSVNSSSTSEKGVVQLTDSVDSTSTTTAATPNSVKQAYDKARLAIEQISATDQNLANLINKTLPDYTNQHAFSHVVVDSTNIAADSATDTITIAAGDNITITPDTANDKITFSVANGSTTAKGVVQLTDSVNSTSTTTAATPKNVKQAYDLASGAKEDAAAALAEANRKYSHPINSGNKHIPSGGSSGQILRWSADGTATWGADNNTTYGVVSTTADGLAPKRDGSTAKFLRADGTWAVPPDTNTDTNTTYTIATGDSSGQIKVTSSSGAAYNVSVKGLGSAAYTNHTDYAAYSHTHSGYAGSNHNQASNTINAMTGYSKPSTTGAISTSDSLNAAIGKLEKALESKGTSNLTLGTTATTAAAGNHTHSYAAASHTHDDIYYTESEINTKLNGKSDTSHTHDDRYYTETEVNNLLSGKAASSHGNHVPATQAANNATFLRNDNTWQTVTPANIGAAAASHTHDDRYYTESEINTKLNGKSDTGHTHDYAAANHTHSYAATSHTHDDRYYTESEVDTKLAGKSNTSHTHDYASSSHTHTITAANFVVPTSLIYTSADNLPSSGTAGQLYFVKRSVQG